MNRSALCVSAVTLAIAASSHAQVINADGAPGTTAAHLGAIWDQSSGLLWLDATETENRSLADVQSLLGPGQEFGGWRVATLAELQTLWANFGLIETTTWVSDPAQNAAMASFLSIYGEVSTEFQPNYTGTQVWYETSVADGAPAAMLRRDSNDDYWLRLNQQGNAGAANPAAGVALVRGAFLPGDPGLYAIGNNGQLEIIDPDAATRLTLADPPTATSFYTDMEYGLGSFVYADGNRNGILQFYDADTMALTRTLTLSLPAGTNNVTALEFVGDELYIAATQSGGGGGASTLARVNLATGATTPIGPIVLNAGAPTVGLAWDGSTMYATNGGGSSAFLGTVDLSTGATTVIGPVSGGMIAFNLTGLSFGNDGRLFGMGRSPSFNEIIQINPATGGAVSLGVPQPNPTTMNGLTNVPSEDLGAGIYAIENNMRNIAAVDTANGQTFPNAVSGATDFYSEIEHAKGFFYCANGTANEPPLIEIVDDSTFEVVNRVVFDGLPNREHFIALEMVGDRLFANLNNRDTGDNTLVELDLAARTITALAPTPGNAPVSGMTADGPRLLFNTGGSAGNSSLYEYILETGAINHIAQVTDATTGGTMRLTGLEFGADGVLYGLERGGPTSARLRSIDPATGVSTSIGDLPFAPSAYNGITAVNPGLIVSEASGIPEDFITDLAVSAPAYTGTRTDWIGNESVTDIAAGRDVIITVTANGGDTYVFDAVTRARRPDVTPIFPTEGSGMTAVEFVGSDPIVALNQGQGDMDGPSFLARFDLATGVITTIGDTGLATNIGGLAYDGSRMLLVSGASTGVATLYEASLVTGAATPIAPVIDAATGLGVPLTGLCFSADGTLWGLGQRNGPGGDGTFDDRLLRIDPATGIAFNLGEIAGHGLPGGITALCGFDAKGLDNPSFETGAFDGWLAQDIVTPFQLLRVLTDGQYNPFGLFASTATDGIFSANNGFDGSASPTPITVAQPVFIDAPTLAFDWRAGWDFGLGGTATIPRTFDVVLRSPASGAEVMRQRLLSTGTQSQNPAVPDTGPRTARVDVSAFIGSTVNAAFEWTVPQGSTGPGHAQLDNVCLEDRSACAADVTTTGATLPGQIGFGQADGVADLDDLGYFLNFWLAGELNADFTTTGATLPGQIGFGFPDGAVDLDDLGFFLNAWLMGCV